jgi:hypothetical protein
MITVFTVVIGLLFFSFMILREAWKQYSRSVQRWTLEIIKSPKVKGPWTYTTPSRLTKPPQGMGREGFYR